MCSRRERAASFVLALFVLLTSSGCLEREPRERLRHPRDGGLRADERADGAPDGDADPLDVGIAEGDATFDVPADGFDAGDAADVSSFPDAAVVRPRAALVVPEGWRVLGTDEDPFPDRPADVLCFPAAIMAELLGGERVLSVDTAGCDYVTVAQRTRREIAPGETVKVRLWHFELDAPEAAEAHAALRIDGMQLLDERIPIPQPGGLIVKYVRAERAIAAGAQALFHLHNHGANSWALVEVSAGP